MFICYVIKYGPIIHQGAQVTAMDVKEDNGTTFLAVGTSQSGTLYLYTVNVTSGQPIPAYQSIYR